jgi:hypothetical protein
MKLFVSGKTGDLVNGKLSPMMLKVKKLLDESNPGELFTGPQLAQLVGCGAELLRIHARKLPHYWHLASPSLRYWGRPETIGQLRRELRK